VNAAERERVVADRLRRISAVADDIASRPDLGPYEVGLLKELLEEANALTGAARPARTRFWHDSPGRAVDILPGDPFDYVRRFTGRYDVAAAVWGSS
jgi:hypothetical protein